jgi:hypothetical protein
VRLAGARARVCVCVCVSLGIDLSSSSHSATVIRTFSNLGFRVFAVCSVHYDEVKTPCNTNKCEIITPKHVAAMQKIVDINYRMVHSLVLHEFWLGVRSLH